MDIEQYISADKGNALILEKKYNITQDFLGRCRQAQGVLKDFESTLKSQSQNAASNTKDFSASPLHNYLSNRLCKLTNVTNDDQDLVTEIITNLTIHNEKLWGAIGLLGILLPFWGKPLLVILMMIPIMLLSWGIMLSIIFAIIFKISSKISGSEDSGRGCGIVVVLVVLLVFIIGTFTDVDALYENYVTFSNNVDAAFSNNNIRPFVFTAIFYGIVAVVIHKAKGNTKKLNKAKENADKLDELIAKYTYRIKDLQNTPEIF